MDYLSFSQNKIRMQQSWDEDVYPCPYGCSSKHTQQQKCPSNCVQGYVRPTCLKCTESFNSTAHIGGLYKYKECDFLLCRQCWLTIQSSLTKLKSMRKQTYRKEAKLNLISELGLGNLNR